MYGSECTKNMGFGAWSNTVVIQKKWMYQARVGLKFGSGKNGDMYANFSSIDMHVRCWSGVAPKYHVRAHIKTPKVP
jgi:hypothetical protein